MNEYECYYCDKLFLSDDPFRKGISGPTKHSDRAIYSIVNLCDTCGNKELKELKNMAQLAEKEFKRRKP